MIVKYSKKFPYAPYLNEDIGFEITIPDGNDVDAVLSMLKLMAEDFHKKNNPGLHVTVNPEYANLIPQGQQPLPTVDYRAKEKLEIDIDNATTKADLEFYIEAAEKYGLMKLWNDKYNSL